MTRGSLTTFSIANDVAKYFAIIPALFVPLYPRSRRHHAPDQPHHRHLGGRHTTRSSSWRSSRWLLKARYREATSQSLLKRNLAVYGLGGIVLPFAAIKLLDMGLTALGVA